MHFSKSAPNLRLRRNCYLQTIAPASLIFCAILLGGYFVVIPEIKKLLLTREEVRSMELLRNVWSLIDQYRQRQARGELDLAQAQRQALETVQGLRYGKDMREYFWILDAENNLLSHPYVELGNLSNFADPSGYLPVPQMTAIAQSHGEGSLTYFWQYHDDPNDITEKVSSIKAYEPWGWTLGTGFYLREVERSLNELIKSFIPLLATATAIFGALLGVIVHRGIRDLRNQEAYLRELAAIEKRFRLMALNIGHGLIVIENDLVTFANPFYRRLKPETDHANDAEAATAFFKKRFGSRWIENLKEQAGSSHTPSYRLHEDCGDAFFLQDTLTRDAETNTLYVVTTDLTEIERRREEIHKLSSIVTQSPLTVVITDLNGNIQYANPFFEKATGYRIDEVFGTSTRVLKSNQMPPSLYQEMWSTITQGQTWRGELRNKRKDGSLFWEDALIFPLHGTNNQITNFVAIKQDITQQKQLEQSLRDTLDRVEESNRMKSAFLNNISHEVRTPLNAIQGFASLLAEDDTPPEDRVQFAEIIQNRVESLIHIIEDLLKAAELQAQTVRPNFDFFNLNESLRDLLKRFESKNRTTENKPIEFKLELDPQLPEGVYFGDRLKLEQILYCLLSNALKFTPKGSITLGYEHSETRLLLYVHDTGIGISPAEQANVFDLFSHGSSKTALHEGTGLGLPIAKHYIELFGGSIRLESTPDKGSSFYVSLPNPASERS